jgi:hypothetical protein
MIPICQLKAFDPTDEAAHVLFVNVEFDNYSELSGRYFRNSD